MANVQVRGCCCGIPFGCGLLALALLATVLWKLVTPLHLGLPGGATLALLGIPVVALALGVGMGARRR